MYKYKRNKKTLSTIAISIAFSLMLFANIAQAKASEIDVKMGHHGNYTRVAFEFPRLTAYWTEKLDNSLNIRIGINEQIKLPNRPTPIVKGISQTIEGEELIISIKTSGNFSLKDYRKQRKIIFDIYEQVPKKAAKKTETKKVTKKAAPKKEVKKAEKIKTKAPAKKLEAKKKKLPSDIAAKNLKEVREKLAKYINVAEKEATGEEALPDLSSTKKIEKVLTKKEQNIYNETPTKIAITRLTPFKLAVFERTNLLWIVTNSKGQADIPLIEGPLKTFISKPQIFKFEQGTAYAYKLPKKLFPLIKKHGLLWEISLYNKDYTKKEPATVKTVFDDAGQEAKVSINLKSAGDPIIFEDPIVGDKLIVVPTEKAGNMVINNNDNNDFKLYPAELGLVIKPYSDKLKTYSIKDFVFITSDRGGLNLQNSIFSVIASKEENNGADINYINANRIFNFPDWSKGELKDMRQNKIDLQDLILEAESTEEATALILELAKLYFANGFGYEAAGMLDIAEENNPELVKSSSFIAIRGAVEALAGRYDKALKYFSYPPIQQNPEIKLWRGMAAAKTEQWTKAERSFPNNNILLLQYPKTISVSFTLYMAESALRLGKTKSAEDLLNTIKQGDDSIGPHHKAAIEYLKGEVANQRGNYKKAIEIWEPVAEGIDRLYHTKAALSLANLKVKKKMISLDEAINDVESLRFAWRGDRLEVEVLNTLGRLKEQNQMPLEALEDYQSAIKISRSIKHDFAYILDDMREVFYSLFMEDAYKDVNPLEAISIYNKFHHLYPQSETSARIAIEFSEYLVKADLLPKAAKLLEKHLDKKVIPYDLIPSAGNKLAAIYLMEHRPRKALKALLATRLDTELPKLLNQERVLLKAQAYSKLEKTDMAIKLLSTIPSRKTELMKADVLWKAKEWTKAADIILTLLPADMKQLKANEDADHIINIAIAYKFAKQDSKLEELKNKYAPFMNSTNKAATFKVITRKPLEATMSDKVTIKKIASEATVFKNFFENYKSEIKK